MLNEKILFVSEKVTKLTRCVLRQFVVLLHPKLRNGRFVRHLVQIRFFVHGIRVDGLCSDHRAVRPMNNYKLFPVFVNCHKHTLKLFNFRCTRRCTSVGL